MVVTLRALDGETENAFADGVHAIKHRFHAELLWIRAAFFVDHGIAQEAGGNDVVLRGVWQQIAGELFGDELIVGQVVVEGFDHPIAIEPNVARLVFLEAIGIRVARGVEPVASPFLAVVRRCEQTLHLFCVSIGRFVDEKRVHFLRRRWQADEIE